MCENNEHRGLVDQKFYALYYGIWSDFQHYLQPSFLAMKCSCVERDTKNINGKSLVNSVTHQAPTLELKTGFVYRPT